MKCLGNGLVKTGDQSSHSNPWNVQNGGAMLLMKGNLSKNFLPWKCQVMNQNQQ